MLESKTSKRVEILNLDLQTSTQKWRENSSPLQNLTLEVKSSFYLCPLPFIPSSNVIFPFWFIDKSALAYRSNSWSNLAIPMQVYRYTFVVYRYTFATVNFLHMCTDTLCPLPLFLARCTGTHKWCTGTLFSLVLF